MVKLAQIGLGGWSEAIADGVKRSKKAELLACFDLLPEKRMLFSKKYGCDQEEDYETVLKRNDIDGVLLTTPNAVHAEQTVLAAQYGKHVWVEKPIANTIADGKKMIEACKKAGVVLMVGHFYRRFSGFRKIRKLIEEGAIGDPVQVEFNMSSGSGFSFTPESFRWQGDDSGCPGGPLMTHGVHAADTLNYLFGPMKTVTAIFNRLFIPAPVEDVTATIIQFESGVLGYIGCNYASLRTTWMYVYGTEANLLCTITRPEAPITEISRLVPLVDRNTQLKVFKKGKNHSRGIPLTEGDPVLEEIDEFAECVQTGNRPETDGQGALSALALIRAAIESTRTGKRVELVV